MLDQHCSENFEFKLDSMDAHGLESRCAAMVPNGSSGLVEKTSSNALNVCFAASRSFHTRQARVCTQRQGLPCVELRVAPERAGAQRGPWWRTGFACSVTRTRFGCTTALNCFLPRAAPPAAAIHAQLCATSPTVTKACSRRLTRW
mmetsp:Transcript_21041/g.54224  ORF Transcript_21041/g.54224 Transcript_21041/m.54224 type:complete len:146 (+) Transcript_21041:577-1014(+)